MACIVTVASQKGGVGKTTTAVNLAASLSLSGRRILLVDFDPQGNASSGVGVSPRLSRASTSAREGFLRHCLQGKFASDSVRGTRFENLAVVEASAELSELDLIREIQETGLEKVRKQLVLAGRAFDYVLLDCPPSLGGLPTIALALSNKVLIPIQCEYYAMEGLSQILPVIHKIASSINPDLEIGGLLLTMFSDDLELSHEVVEEITGYFEEAVFQTIIPRDVVLAEAASHGLPAFHYQPTSRGAWSYLELAKEVLENGSS